jgi:antitoxin component of MazEF toxin-antitoxin module
MYILYKHLLEVAMARLTRWGNSDGGLRIPKPILEAAGLRVGDEIGCRLLDSGAILLTPRRKHVTISEDQVAALKVKQTDPKW